MGACSHAVERKTLLGISKEEYAKRLEEEIGAISTMPCGDAQSLSDTSKATVLCAHAKLILPFGTSRKGAYTGESRGINITMIGELINKITLVMCKV